MYVAKVYTRDDNGKQVYHDIRHYKHFESAVSEISDKGLFDNLSDDLYDTLGKCTIFFGGISNDTNMADDFEFRFENGVVVYVGTIIVEDLEVKEVCM